MSSDAKLSSDVPVSDPADDAYGFAPFAKNLAKAIRNTPSPHGLVMAVNGPWGAGKSSMLNLVKYELKAVLERDGPIIVEFNPWWFNGRDQLATQMLAQLGTKLRGGSSELLIEAGNLMSEYSSALSAMVALSTGISWIDKPVNFLLKRLKYKPREIPQLKSDIAKRLQKSDRRILLIVDDLDRLTPEEIREVFKVVKALADFPNVIYLLSFDKTVVANSLGKSLGVDGAAYLEKIIQASFALPAVDSMRLQKKLFSDLDTLVSSLPTVKTDSTYWGNLYFDGLNTFINKPRDIVRLMNALAVTYPPVAGEVNPVDYIALECLRLFQPTVYRIIRDNKEKFAGVLSEATHVRDATQAFHQKWLSQLDERDREPVTALVQRLFPKVESAIGRMNYSSNSAAGWRQNFRICSPELFNLFFQFSMPDDYLKQSELLKLLELTSDIPVLVETLRAATRTERPDGRSKARDYVDRLTQLPLSEINVRQAAMLVEVLLSLEEDLLTDADSRGGMTSIPNTWRLNFLLTSLLERIPQGERWSLLQRSTRDGKAFATVVILVSRLEDAVADPSKHRPWMDGITEADVGELRATLVARIENARLGDLLATSDFRLILYYWSNPIDEATMRAKFAHVLDDGPLLVAMLTRFLSEGSAHAWGDRVSRTVLQLDPRALEKFFDLEDLLQRVDALRPGLPEGSRAAAAAEKFVKGMERVRAGLPTGSGGLDIDD